ncbi:IS630 family transposase [Microbacterium profundi]|uniref:IS630 family transposase n=1 Tax=Microbacterium profundi TaxID=450380 RepID=A0ABV3LEG4_9MICO
MATINADVILLTDTDKHELSRRVGRVRTEVRDQVRARIILHAARGTPNQQIADRMGVHVDTVRKWRSRFAADGLDGLRDLPRTGRPPVFAPAAVAEIKALACQLPAETGAPLSRWSHTELATEAVDRGVVEAVSASTVRRWLNEDAIKPWQHRSWIFPRDPDFAAKAGRVLDLYARIWNGKPLSDDEYVISADEKSQLQALHRRHPGLPPAPGRARRVEFEYRRGGTLAYLAGYDVHHARVIGRCAPTTGITPFTELVEQVMTCEPYASARRVFWVVDNGSSHVGTASVKRMRDAWPTAQLVHLPVHASWLNQVEIYFSIVQRKVVQPQDFADLHALEDRLLAFQDRYNTTATPFNWRFGRTALHDLLDRVNRHEQAAA